MNRGDYRYIWQAPDRPNWRYDLAALATPLAEVSRAQGLLPARGVLRKSTAGGRSTSYELEALPAE
jgi:hypothetical protein